MKTTKIYKKNLAEKNITKEMLVDCIYSVNKRAIMWSDREQEFGVLSEEGERCGATKDDYYAVKNYLLSFFEPTCIQVVDTEVRAVIQFDPFWTDHEPVSMVLPVTQHYLYFDLGKHSFHVPVNEEELAYYSYLEVIRLDDSYPEDEEISYMLSDEFVYEVVKLLRSNQFTFVA